MHAFVEAEWLKENLEEPDTFVIDCRFDLFDPQYGERSYKESHIKGAFFLDVNRDICGSAKACGGARPVPDSAAFARKLEDLGMGSGSTIVVYDDDIYGAARAFWQMKYIGLEKVHILMGGWKGWIDAGGAFSAAVPEAPGRGEIRTNMDESIYCDMDHVIKRKDLGNTALIDGRKHERFTGAYEPLYAKAGHIPGALNCPCSENLASEGRLKDWETLRKLYEPLAGYDEIISYCGSGIAGALNFVVLRELGMPVRLYAGSLSDWIGRTENPVETGE